MSVTVGGLSFWEIWKIVKFYGAISSKAKPKDTEIQSEVLVDLLY